MAPAKLFSTSYICMPCHTRVLALCCSPPVCASFHLPCSACVHHDLNVLELVQASTQPVNVLGDCKVRSEALEGDFSDLALSFPSGVFWGLYVQETEVIRSILQGYQIVTLFFNGQKSYLKSLRLLIMPFSFMFFICNLEPEKLANTIFSIQNKIRVLEGHSGRQISVQCL